MVYQREDKGVHFSPSQETLMRLLVSQASTSSFWRGIIAGFLMSCALITVSGLLYIEVSRAGLVDRAVEESLVNLTEETIRMRNAFEAD